MTTTPAAALDLRYPIGKFQPQPAYTETERAAMIQEIAELPAKLRSAVSGLNEQQLETRYREGGWTVRQVVHHLADSHMNSYVRFRLALTENAPTIKPYDEAAWAELTDARREPVEISLRLLESLHHRWVVLLQSLTPEDWKHTFVHPERGSLDLATNLALYAWHGKHHVAHILGTRKP
ncbi:MAG TPA: bacillithiol transferase BstA [Terriglobales bacterium]|nr:bacillithiol transferase BstA [Terriglobales bacterium]